MPIREEPPVKIDDDWSEYSFDPADLEETTVGHCFPWSDIEESTHHGCSRKILES